MFSVTGEEILWNNQLFNLHVNKSSRQTISSDLSRDAIFMGINNIKIETKDFKSYYDIIPLLSTAQKCGRG